MMLIVIFAVLTLTFFITKAVPGDPIEVMLGEWLLQHPEHAEALRKLWGLDKPIHIQYFTYMNNILHGNLGRAIHTKEL